MLPPPPPCGRTPLSYFRTDLVVLTDSPLLRCFTSVCKERKWPRIFFLQLFKRVQPGSSGIPRLEYSSPPRAQSSPFIPPSLVDERLLLPLFTAGVSAFFIFLVFFLPRLVFYPVPSWDPPSITEGHQISC